MNAARQEWKNWSGSVQAQPSRLASPRTEDELATLVRGAAKVRVGGAGPSFMPLCATSGVLLNIAELDSPIDIAADGASAWVPAGWSLKRLTASLWERGYSLPNQGDINPQSLAGATATGTHGTGIEPREVEHVVDHVEQRIDAGAKGIGQRALLVGELGPQEQRRIADDAVKRGSDFVTGVRQDLLAPAGFLERTRPLGAQRAHFTC